MAGEHLTPEVIKKAQEARKRNKEKMIAEADKLRQDFQDESFWRQLASERGVHLSAWYRPCTVREMRKFLRKLGYTEADYKAMEGCSLKKTIELNPEIPLWSWQGTILETY